MRFLVRFDKFYRNEKGHLYKIEKKVVIVQNCRREEVEERVAKDLGGKIIARGYTTFVYGEDHRPLGEIKDVSIMSISTFPDVVWLN